MLTEIDTPDVGVGQRSAACAKCEAVFPYRTCRPELCPGCRRERRRETYRKAAEVQRRKRGVAHVKGTAATCDRCGTAIVRATRTHRFCDGCAPVAALEYSREYQRIVRKRRRFWNMPKYLVRYIEDKTPLGTFRAQTEAELWDRVDAEGDPSFFEYMSATKASAAQENLAWKAFDCANEGVGLVARLHGGKPAGRRPVFVIT